MCTLEVFTNVSLRDALHLYEFGRHKEPSERFKAFCADFSACFFDDHAEGPSLLLCEVKATDMMDLMPYIHRVVTDVFPNGKPFPIYGIFSDAQCAGCDLVYNVNRVKLHV